jgi:hypothetical protein
MPPSRNQNFHVLAGRMDDRQPNSGLPRYGLNPGEHATAHFVLNIPSSRLDQHGSHDVALKVVRPRLRLRALHL